MPLDIHSRPRIRRSLSSKLLLAIASSLATTSAVHAAGGAWLGAAGSAWSDTSNWSVAPVPGAGDTATFNGAGAGNTTIDLGAGVTVGSVLFDTASAAAYTIGSGGAGGQTLTLGTAGNAITVNAGVAANQSFNANLALTVTRTASDPATYYAVANNSATNTLILAGGISAGSAGVKVLNVTGSGATTLSGAFASGAGNLSLFKTGSGTLTLSGGATFSGNGVTDGANFATSAVFREGTTVLAGGTYNNSGGEIVIGGVATHGGAGTDTTLRLSGTAILENVNWLSVGRGNGNGSATSNLTLDDSSSASSTNMSAGFNAGNVANLPKGTITLNGTSSLTVATTVNIAESPGSAVTLNLNGSSQFRQTTPGSGETRVGISDNSVGTINVNGGTASFERDAIIGFTGTATGRLNLTSGTVNVASTLERWLMLGRDGASKGEITVSGGSLNLNTNTDIRFGRIANASGASFINLNGGAITGWTGNASGAFSGTSVVDLNYASTQATYDSSFNLNGGTLTIGQIITNNNSGNAKFNFNGGTLRAAAATANFIDLGGAAQRVNVRNGGAVIDSNGFDLTVPQALLHSSIDGDAATDGGLTKLGSGTLTLTAVNTYTGDTTINGGGLTLADNASLKFVIGANGVNNKVTGNGTFTINGDFVFDLAGASTTLGNSWQIVDVSTLAETFGETFTVPDFTLNAAKWVRPVNGAFYEFDPATGVLRVINDPDFVYPPPAVTQGGQGTAYVSGTDIVLNVSATGFGDLTYQWYYQADAGATPVAISGATGATLTVANANATNGGIYSVIVTDHAAEASGKPATTSTVTFAPITVQPASELAVAYYRFEDGANGANISPALDSIGGSDLSLLGTATYSDAALPYSTVPATGDANTLGANFPATGNNGLVGPSSGALAGTALTNFTVEAFVRFSDLTGTQTIVGRDDSAVVGVSGGQGLGNQGLFYLSKSAAGFRVELITKDNRNIQINSTTVPAINTWYHVAAVGDAGAGTLKLYVNGTQVGSVTGFNGLFVPTAGSDTPWTVGRGDFNLGDVDFFRGDLDEVRITRAALAPGQFLNTADGVLVIPPTASVSPTQTTVYPGADVVFTATASSNMGGTLSYQWYENGTLLPGETAATLSRPSVTLAADGAYSVVVTDSAGASVGSPLTTTATTRLRVLDVPSAGARSIGLNFVGAATGTNNWSKELGTLSAAQSAGTYPMANWNNSASVTGVAVQSTPLPLLESDASSSAAVSATWNAVGAWSAQSGTGAVSAKTPNGLLLHGYIESRLAAGASVTVSNIPYASYDVYVHVAGGANGEVGSLRIDREGAPTYYYRVLQHDSYTVTPVPDAANPYTVPVAMGDSLTRSDALVTPPATFVRFAGVSGTDLTITAIDSVLNRNAGGIAAVEIVDRTPAGAAYPIVVSSAPASKIVRGGANVSFAATAVSQNSGTLAYQWKKDGADLPGETGATLNLSNVTGASSGNYSLVITDTSALGTVTTTRGASLIVVDATRSLLINGDLNTAASPTQTGEGILRADGTSTVADLGTGTTVWNGILGAAGAATRPLARESTGLSLPSVSFSYANAGGVEDNTAVGAIASSAALALSRDYLYTDNQTTPLTATVGGLQALAGKQVTLMVYAYGKLTTAYWENGYPGQVPTGTEPATLGTSDTATVTLAGANNHLATAPVATTTIGNGAFGDAGRKIEDNNLETTGGASAAYATFTGVVAADGTVSWTLGPDSDAGRIPLVGFQLLVTGTDVAPPVPAGLAATVGPDRVDLSWTASAGASTYTIKRATAITGPYTPISQGVTVGTSYTDNNATGGTTYYYTVAAANSLAQSADSDPVSATPLSSLSAMQTWRQTHFGTSANEGDAANTADPDQDGQSNLLEYALGTNPKAAGSLPVTVARSGQFLSLSFSHIGDITLVYRIEASNDLTSWSTAHTYDPFDSAGTETYTDTVALTSQARRFLRLVVTAP